MRAGVSLLAVLVLLSLVLSGCGGGVSSDIFGSYALRASQLAKEEDPTAKVYYVFAGGLGGQAIRDPEELEDYSYWALSKDGGGWFIRFDSESWIVNPTEDVLSKVDTDFDVTSVDMDVTTAWGRVKESGLAEFFFSVELFRPKDSELEDPYYVFDIGEGEFIAVNADTGDILTGEDASRLVPRSEDVLGKDELQAIWDFFVGQFVIPEVFWKGSTGKMTEHEPISFLDFEHVGRGYYLAGNVGPGEDRSYARYTVYYPLDWGHVGVTKYHFTFHSGPQYKDIEQLVFDLQVAGNSYAQECLGFDSVDELVSLVRDFYSKYGDFAITVAYSTHSGNSVLYLNLLTDDPDICDRAVQHDLIQGIYNALKPKRYAILCGKDIEDTWYLRRPLVLFDGSWLIIDYVMGTISVWYD
ncbi:hypothetical protein H5T51_00860 [Candidatus Bathyarchaeota archaeon]|nr:hypothetical protein [Candidatus Bathyarchaeota archaeon]